MELIVLVHSGSPKSSYICLFHVSELLLQAGACINWELERIYAKSIIFYHQRENYSRNYVR